MPFAPLSAKRRFTRMCYRERVALLELLLLLVAVVALHLLFVRHNVFEIFSAFSAQHENWELDELLLSFSVLPWLLGIFAWRRWRESSQRFWQSHTDVLTGLPNRRRGKEVLAQNVSRAQRHGRTFSLLLLDLDHFKTINDRHGHAEGDHVLQIAAQQLHKNLRDLDIVVRWGGEEFLVICADTDLAQALSLAQRLTLALPAAVQSQGHPVTTSIGVSEWQAGDLDSADPALKRADLALYAAKLQGRNRALAQA